MNKKDKEIEALKEECREKEERIGALLHSNLAQIEGLRELRSEIEEWKRKYASLLERYIVTMERTVGLDERN